MTARMPFSIVSIALLALLLVTDVGFIFLHLVHMYTPFLEVTGYSLDQERGYAEVFQYVKYFWVALLLGALALIRREWIYGVWMVLFFYLLGDDASQFHELGGKSIMNLMDYEDQWGLRAQDFGELSVSLIVLTVFLLLNIKAYASASTDTRTAIKIYGLLLALLAFFGVVVDILNVLTFGNLHLMVGVLEDGGELLSMSLLCWFSFHLLEHMGTLPVQAWKRVLGMFMNALHGKYYTSNV